HANIPQERRMPRNDKEMRGMEFLRRIHSPTRGVLIAPLVDGKLAYAMGNLENCVLVEEGGELEQQLVNVARDTVLSVAQKVTEKKIRITYILNSESSSGSMYSIEGIGFAFSHHGTLQFDHTTEQRLVKISRHAGRVKSYPDWEEELRDIGDD